MSQTTTQDAPEQQQQGQTPATEQQLRMARHATLSLSEMSHGLRVAIQSGAASREYLADTAASLRWLANSIAPETAPPDDDASRAEQAARDGFARLVESLKCHEGARVTDAVGHYNDALTDAAAAIRGEG